MTQQEEIINTIKVLRKEVEVLTTRLLPAGTGYLHTAIDVINGRIDELIGKAIDNEPDQVRGLAGKIFDVHNTDALIKNKEWIFAGDEDVYDGYKEHTDAMELSRLREIQDKAAGRNPNKVRDAYLHSSKDDYEHTKEYYDTERNKPMEGEELSGLSNRSMKQRYGQAVMTTSEMMQDELEPLPINTFK